MRLKGKEKTTIHRNGTGVAGHVNEGRNPGQPDFLSRYHSQAHTSQGRLSAVQGSCPRNRVGGGHGSETKLEGDGTVDSSQEKASDEG